MEVVLRSSGGVAGGKVIPHSGHRGSQEDAVVGEETESSMKTQLEDLMSDERRKRGIGSEGSSSGLIHAQELTRD